jgi:hypothetical protein
LGDQPLEPVGVELTRADVQLVPACGRRENLGVAERLAQA